MITVLKYYRYRQIESQVFGTITATHNNLKTTVVSWTTRLKHFLVTKSTAFVLTHEPVILFL